MYGLFLTRPPPPLSLSLYWAWMLNLKLVLILCFPIFVGDFYKLTDQHAWCEVFVFRCFVVVTQHVFQIM